MAIRSTWEAFAFLEAVAFAPDPLGDQRRNLRSTLVFDALGSTSNLDRRTLTNDESDLAIIRVLSTKSRLTSKFGIEWREGEWYQLRFEKRSDEPPAWVLPARGDYSGTPIRTNLVAAQRIRPTGPAASLRTSLIQMCKVATPQASQVDFSGDGTSYRLADLHVRVVDVGQASFCAFHIRRDADSPVIGYFDVGGPMFFHGKTFPKKFPDVHKVPERGFVALSHWDFDHYSLARTKLKTLQQLNWFAPDQAVGANCAAFQTMLGTRLTLVSGSSYALGPGLVMRRGTGKVSDRNASGYVLVRGSRKSGFVLLTGDVPYDSIPTGAKSHLQGLVVCHHGGASSATPPTPSVMGASAAVSYGHSNYYHHPSEPFLVAHGGLGWKVRRTSAHGATPRADIWLP